MGEFWFGVIVVALIVALEMGSWLHGLYRQWKAKQKAIASKPVDGTFWLYDSKGEVKRLGHEPRELTRKERKGA